MSRLGEALTDPALDPPVAALVVWNSNPLVVVPNAELVRAGAGARRPVHRRPRAVPHGHRPLRRRRPAGHDADRSRPMSCRHGATCGWAGTRRRSRRSASRAATRSCSAVSPRRWGSRSRRCTPTTRRCSPKRSVRDVDLDELARVGWVRVPYPEDGRAWGDGVFPTASGKVELVSDALVRMGQPALPTFVAPREGPHGDPELVARYPLQLLTPKHHSRLPQLRLLPPAQARSGRGRPVRRAGRRRTPRRAASPKAIWHGCGTTGPRWRCRRGSATGCGPASSPSRSAGGSPSIPTARRPTSLTNDTLTEWGGGVAYSDTLVQVDARS